MKKRIKSYRALEQGASMVLVLVITGTAILLVSGVLSYINTNNKLTERVNRYESLTAAAGAATEKIAAHMMRDFQSADNAAVLNNLGVYRTLVPTTNDATTSGGGGGLIGGIGNIVGGLLPGTPTVTDWTRYEFSDAQGNVGRTYVNSLTPWNYTNVSSRFPGVNGYCATYRLISNVRNSSSIDTVSAIKQDVSLVSIPVFHYQVFYSPDLEIHPGAGMNLGGRVHCNQTIYSEPGAAVTLSGPVTASGKLRKGKHPNDPVLRTGAAVNLAGGHESGINTLNLPLGTNTSLSAGRSIIEIPPRLESVNSTFGRQRLYNKADLIVLISNNTAVARSGAYNNFAVTIPWADISESVTVVSGKVVSNGYLESGGNKYFRFGGDSDDDDDDDKTKKHDEDDDDDKKKPKHGVTNIVHGIFNTNVTFFNARENKTVRCTDVDIDQLLVKASYLTTRLGRPVKTLYVADMRTQTSSTQSGIRIINGKTLPAGGLTIATPNPLYVQGHYNVPPAYVGTTNTSGSVPAALIADSITILSTNWADANSTRALTYRIARSTTVNAALLAGIVPTGNGYYSGGVENMPRLLEDWSGQKLALNGSLVVLYQSAISTAPWGARPDVYKPPQRQWSFDVKLGTLAGLPPSTPEVRTIVRRGWETVQANRVY